MFHSGLAGNEEVKIATLSAIASWAVKSTNIIQESLVSFFASGLKEKETLRRGFLRSLRAICKNADAVLKVTCQLLINYPLLSIYCIYTMETSSPYIPAKYFQMSPLLGPLVQLVKTGFTKAVQRLDGIYALLLVGKIAAVDIKAGKYWCIQCT
jgi:hypothetical protein